MKLASCVDSTRSTISSVSEPTEAPGLEDRARSFAHSLTATVQGTLGPTTPEFVAEASPKRSQSGVTRVSIHTIDNAEIVTTIDGVAALLLVVNFTCEWDQEQSFLAVRRAGISILSVDSTEPLMRYEFVNAMDPSLPSAHLHVHAHRDEILYQLFRATKGKAKSRAKAVLDDSRASPRLSSIHLPVGGPRMRPALEDVLQMLINEFCIDHEDGAIAALTSGRADWRRSQIGASVRDAPAEAVRVLQSLGYDVAWPHDRPEPAEHLERLTCM